MEETYQPQRFKPPRYFPPEGAHARTLFYTTIYGNGHHKYDLTRRGRLVRTLSALVIPALGISMVLSSINGDKSFATAPATTIESPAQSTPESKTPRDNSPALVAETSAEIPVPPLAEQKFDLANAVISPAGLDTLKQLEGFRSAPYDDGFGTVTIGYGTTHYPDGRKVTSDDPSLSKDEAEQIMTEEIEQEYARAVKDLVKTELNQNQFDALVSLVYNIGHGQFARSTALKIINENPNDPAIRDAFMLFAMAGGEYVSGLKDRHAAEANRYFSSYFS
jgi:lysozyme